MVVPFAAAFGYHVAVDELWLGWLLWEPDPAFGWFLVIPLLLSVMAAAGATMVLLGRRGGWAVQATAAVLPLAALLVLVFLLGAFGAVGEMVAAVLLAVGPLTALLLAFRRPVREWCGATRSRGGRRGVTSSR
jgi:hypothetical protein